MREFNLFIICFCLFIVTVLCWDDESNDYDDSRHKDCDQLMCPLGTPNICNFDKSCVNFQTDCNNCGSCGTKCPSGQGCSNGRCVCPSATPNSCGSDGTAFCTNFATDPNNCGSCGTKCPPAQTCLTGTCSCPLIPEEACFERASSTDARLNEEVQIGGPSYTECVTFCKTNSPTSAYVSLYEDDVAGVYRCDCYSAAYTPIPLDANTIDPPCSITTNAAGPKYIYGHYISGSSFTGVSEWTIRICP